MKLSNEDKAGLYITLIFHLVVLIILLIVQIGFSLQRENSFVLDFTKQEEIEKVKKEEIFKEDIQSRIEELLAASGNVDFRNVAVDRGALKDDRGTNAEELYKDAERLQQELNNGVAPQEEDTFASLAQETKKETKKESSSNYSGPSVVSYELEGRKASRLSIPAYRCLGAGMVTVIITVDNQGNVILAKVLEEGSSQDKCLRDFAVRAARMSKFSASQSAPARQVGNIVYQFIAQ